MNTRSSSTARRPASAASGGAVPPRSNQACLEAVHLLIAEHPTEREVQLDDAAGWPGDDRLGCRVDLRVLVRQPQRRCGEVDELGLVGQQDLTHTASGLRTARLPERLFGRPPQLGDSVVRLLHPAASTPSAV